MNKNNLEYVGKLPSIEFFNEDVTLDEYNEYLKEKKIFNLKKETILYCENDVKLTINVINFLLN